MAKYDPDWVRAHYDDYGSREWHRWDESPVERVKFFVHLHYVQRAVEPGDRVLEIGAGAGRFTRELAHLTDRIVVADLSPMQLRLNRENAARLDFESSVERWVECDVCDLRGVFDDAAFDSVVCLGGPLSYVFDRRRDAAAELRRVVKPGGRVLIGVMSLWGTVHQYLPGVLDIEDERNRAIIESGDLTPETVGPDRHYTHMYRAREFRDLLETADLTVDSLSASDCLAVNWSEMLGEISEDDPRWSALIEMEIEASREPGCVDMGTHMIAACRRPSEAQTAGSP